MKNSVFILLFLLLPLNANAFSELIPSDNFSVKYENNFNVKCNVVDPYSFQEAVLDNPQARERVQMAKQALEYAYAATKVQETLGLANPGTRSLAGFYCTALEVDALRYGIEATSIIARQVDTELEKLEFEIGNNFTGPGSDELIDAKEASNIKGVIGETIVKIQRDVAEATWEIERQNARKAGTTAVWLIQNAGANQKLEVYLKKIEKSQGDVKTLEQISASQLQEGIQQAQEAIDELEEGEVEKLGKFELNQLELAAKDTTEVDITYATSPAGLLDESKRNLEKARSIQRSAPLFTAKGRTANKINSYRNGLKSVALSKIASENSLEITLETLEEIEKKAEQEIELAKNIDKPIGKSMAKKLIASVKLGDSYFSKISNLNSLANNLRNLREVYSGKVDEGEKLNLKIEIRNLQRMAKAAVVKEIAGAGEIEKSLTSIYELVGETSNTGELQQLEEQTNENREMLTKLIEDKIGGALRQTYNNAQALAAENSLTNLEEKKLGEISDAFSGSGQLAEKISEVDEIQTTLNNIIENALKRKTTSLSSNATNGNITSVNSTASYLTAMAVQKKNESPGQQSETNASTFEVRELLKQLDEITSAGLEAFYTDGRTTKKTLEQLKFETSLKKAQAEAKNIQKNPSGQKTSELKKQIGEMDSAIQEAQRKASVEIAIAEQRSNGTNKEVEKAQQSWESGKYTDALLKAQEINREQQQTSLQQSGKITGQITSAGDEPKLWAIGVSLVIILIGAAYLMYMKRNGNNDQFEQQPS